MKFSAALAAIVAVSNGQSIKDCLNNGNTCSLDDGAMKCCDTLICDSSTLKCVNASDTNTACKTETDCEPY